MNATSIAQQMHVLGVQAKAASSRMAKASAAQKSQALRVLAKLLRSHTAALQVDNAKDIERAKTAGLEVAMVDRLKLTPQVLETCALGCEQLANMPDIIGDIIGMKEQPSGIRVGQMRVPIGVFGMVFESRPNVTIEAASLAIKSGNACILRGGSEAIESNKALAQLVQQALNAQLQYLALTDHDSVNGLAEAQQAAQNTCLTIINGVEISAIWQKQLIHIVGLNVDPQNPYLLAGLAEQAQARAKRGKLIAEKFFAIIFS